MSTMAPSTALGAGKSLLPAGVRSVTGLFSRGDTVAIIGPEGREIARGLAGYDADEARQIAGRKSAEIEAILGYAGRAAMVHRDDMVMTAPIKFEDRKGRRRTRAHA